MKSFLGRSLLVALLLAILALASPVAVTARAEMTATVVDAYGGPEPVPIQMVQVGHRVFVNAMEIDAGGANGDTPARAGRLIGGGTSNMVRISGDAALLLERWRPGSQGRD